MSMEDVSGVVMEVDREGHSRSQRQGCQSLLVLGVQGGAHGDPQVRNWRHLRIVSRCGGDHPGNQLPQDETSAPRQVTSLRKDRELDRLRGHERGKALVS